MHRRQVSTSRKWTGHKRPFVAGETGEKKRALISSREFADGGGGESFLKTLREAQEARFREKKGDTGKLKGFRVRSLVSGKR